MYTQKELTIPLYKTIVRPHLSRMLIPKPRDICYEMCLKECSLTIQETTRLRGNQIEVFKILNRYENIDRNIYFSVKEERIRTRVHGVIFAKKQCIRTFSFSQRTINEWNRLADCVGANV